MKYQTVIILFLNRYIDNLLFTPYKMLRDDEGFRADVTTIITTFALVSQRVNNPLYIWITQCNVGCQPTRDQLYVTRQFGRSKLVGKQTGTFNVPSDFGQAPRTETHELLHILGWLF